MKKIMSLVVLFLFAMASAALASSEVTVKINGEMIEFPDQGPVINQDQRTLVPVRFISEALEAEVEWDGETKTVFITKESDEISLVIGERKATKNGQNITFDTEATIINERTMVPLRFVSEALGASVEWEAETKTVLITTGEQEVVEEEEPEVVEEEKEEQKPISIEDIKPNSVLNKHESWALDDRVIETLTIEDGKLKGHLPKLPNGYYYGLNYLAIDNLGNQYNIWMDEQEGDYFEIDFSNDQIGVLGIVVYDKITHTFGGGSNVRVPAFELWREGQKVRDL